MACAASPANIARASSVSKRACASDEAERSPTVAYSVSATVGRGTWRPPSTAPTIDGEPSTNRCMSLR